ncbi:hypothetical protein LCGC14_2495250 [marine sediment metagenome]|uniref:Uncharacterized protein n=1 Tax=marine sediment metagenome TaxID=412755 RepID=A0A0F9BRG8_9ZZZZ
MTDLQIKKITKEANYLINQQHPLLYSVIKEYMVSYILKALDNLNYEVKKRRAK